MGITLVIPGKRIRELLIREDVSDELEDFINRAGTDGGAARPASEAN